MTAVIHLREGELSFHVVDGDGCVPPKHLAAMNWPGEIWSAVCAQEKPLTIPSLDDEGRFPETAKFFRECGSESLCILPLTTSLHCLGALCIGRERRDAFSGSESSLLSLVSHYAALAIVFNWRAK